MKIVTGVLAPCVTAGAIGLGTYAPFPQTTVKGGDSALTAMPESLEVRFALSALPPSLRDEATVYVLDPAKGYVLHRTGSNGQHCFVERTEWEYADFENQVYYAICYDAAGSESQMRLSFDVAALRAKGLSPQALKEEIHRRISSGAYRPPARAGFSYMVAPLMRAHINPDVTDRTVVTAALPHIMYYAPNVTNRDVGGLPPPTSSPYPFVRQHGPLGYLIQRIGERETSQIVARESTLVRDLCSYRSELCLKGPATEERDFRVASESKKVAKAAVDGIGGMVLAFAEVAGTPEQVFQALTTDEVEKWWKLPGVYRLKDYKADLRVGGPWRVTVELNDGKLIREWGEIGEIQFPSKLVMTRRFGGNPLMGERETTLTYRFEPSSHGTLITVREEGFIGRSQAAYGNAENWEKVIGWLDGYMSSK